MPAEPQCWEDTVLEWPLVSFTPSGSEASWGGRGQDRLGEELGGERAS